MRFEKITVVKYYLNQTLLDSRAYTDEKISDIDLSAAAEEAKAYTDERLGSCVVTSPTVIQSSPDWNEVELEGINIDELVLVKLTSARGSLVNGTYDAFAVVDAKGNTAICDFERWQVSADFSIVFDLRSDTAYRIGNYNGTVYDFTADYEDGFWDILHRMTSCVAFAGGDTVFTVEFLIKATAAEYTDEKTKSTLSDAKAYTDEKISGIDLSAAVEESKAYTDEKTSFFKKIYGKNLYNHETAVVNKSFDNIGNIIDSTSYGITDFIPVKSGETLNLYRADNGMLKNFNMRWIIPYDADKNVIKKNVASMAVDYVIPEGVAFVRAAISNLYITDAERYSVMISYESLETIGEYEPYIEKDTIDIYLPSKSVIGLNDDFNNSLRKKFWSFVVPSMCNTYNTTTEFLAPPVAGDLNTAYSLYDGLVESYPDYVSKSLVGNVTVEGTDLPMYRYDFTPPLVASSNMEDVCKVLITNCTHGQERSQIPTTYRLMLDICENWRTSELLQTLRFNCHFTVIPIVNPYGYINNTRKNENGVDICRNFEPGHTIGNPSDTNYGGETPNSEQSTQIITNLANTEYFDFMLDVHGYGTYSSGFKSGYVTPCMKRPADIAFGRALALWANSKTLKDNPSITDLTAHHFPSMETGGFGGYLSSVFRYGMTIELMYGWGDDSLGSNATGQKLAVEILGGAVLTMLNGYKCKHLEV
jgi:hypothetical protein